MTTTSQGTKRPKMHRLKTKLEIFSNCQTPNPDGSCPGHDKELRHE